jgi:cytochrome b6-f complex iron-sulfur subunit
MAERRAGSGQSRRGFVNWLLGTSFGGLLLAILYPIGRYLIPPASGEAASNSVTLSIRPEDVAPNSGQIFKFGNQAGIILRTPSGELRAFSAVCTHLGCIVQYRQDLSQIWCACHNGHYDLNGRNVSGPPPRPLEEFDVNVRGEQIVVSRGA